MLSWISCVSQKLDVRFKEKVLQKEFIFIIGDPEINHPAIVGCLFCPQRLYLGDVVSECSEVSAEGGRWFNVQWTGLENFLYEPEGRADEICCHGEWIYLVTIGFELWLILQRRYKSKKKPGQLRLCDISYSSVFRLLSYDQLICWTQSLHYYIRRC